MRASAVVLLGVVLVLTLPSAARAEGNQTPKHTKIAFEVYAPSGRRDCPEGEAVARSAAVRLGYDPFDPAGKDAVRITFRVQGKALEAVVRLERASGEVTERTRTSEANDCAELAEVAALTAAALIDPRAVFAGRKEGTVVPGESLDVGHPLEPPATVPEPFEPREAPPPPPPPPPAWQIRVGAFATGCVGCAPASSVGFGVIVGAERRRWGIDFGGHWDLPASTTRDDGSGVSASLLAFQAFPHARFGVLRLGPLGSVGSLFGKSIAVDGPSHDSSLWIGVGARASVELKLAGPLFAHVSLDGLFVPTRIDLRIRESAVWSSPLAAGALSGGVMANF
jgi:hypothetical protein